MLHIVRTERDICIYIPTTRQVAMGAGEGWWWVIMTAVDRDHHIDPPYREGLQRSRHFASKLQHSASEILEFPSAI